MSSYEGFLPRKRGRRYKLSKPKEVELKEDYDAGKLTVDAICIKFDVSRQTLYNVLRRLAEPRDGQL